MQQGFATDILILFHRGVIVKWLIFWLFVFFPVLSSCSTHFYTVNGHEVTLYLDKALAKKVFFFSSLNGYKGQKLRLQNGSWAMTVPADTSFKYFYRVDGEIFVPFCPMKEKDDFGSENCIFEPNL